VNLFHFIDWLLKLPKALEDEFWQDLQTYEEERTMPYITSVERIGRRIGREEGREEERRSLVTLLLGEKFGDLPEAAQTQITALSLKQLEALAIALLKFQSINDLHQWLRTP
jgi:predicted transposase YdaD